MNYNYTGTTDKKSKKGFTMAEALVMLLISSLILAATMPVITKRVRNKIDYKFGPPGGWECEVKKGHSCKTFNPPAKARNFTFYFDNSTVPSFSVQNMGKLTIIGEKEPTITPVTHIIEAHDETEVIEGYGKTDSSWDEIKKTTPMPPDDQVITTHIQETSWVENVVTDPGGCKETPVLYNDYKVYTEGRNITLKGTYCTGAKHVRIVY